MLSSHSNFPIALRTNAGDLEVYIFHLQTWKASFFSFFLFFLFFFFMAFVCSSGLLLPDSKFLLAAKLSTCQIVNYYSISQTFWRWAQAKVFAAGTPHVELLYFSVLDKVLWVKCFSLFYFKTCSDTIIILRLWLNVI